MISQLVLVYATYVLATASPGPSNMAIMATAMREGRASALFIAAGVVTGSLFWAVLAATGLSALLASYAAGLYVIKVMGGLYLIYLAVRAGLSALRPSSLTAVAKGGRRGMSRVSIYRQGLLMHLTNPKAILGWVAIMSLGLQRDASAGAMVAMVGGCAILGVLVFGGYAIVFSTAPMVALYGKVRRWIEGGMCALYGVAGVTLVTSGR